MSYADTEKGKKIGGRAPSPSAGKKGGKKREEKKKEGRKERRNREKKRGKTLIFGDYAWRN